MAEGFRAYLSSFANIFRTDGAKQLPTLIDLNSPAQPVIDLSRLAARGLYVDYSYVLGIPAGGGIFFDTLVFRTTVQALYKGQDIDQLDAWIVDARIIVDTVNFANLQWAHLFYVPSTASPNEETAYPRPIAAFRGVEVALHEIGGQWYPVTLDQTKSFGLGNPFPLYTPLSGGDRLSLRVAGADAVTVRVVYRIWVGPAGATPPGRA